MYETKYHEGTLDQYSFLITGGAGFIGSNLVEYLLKYEAKKVRVLDNLSNGYYENIKEFEGHPAFEFMEGDICDYDTCVKALEGMDYVSHQAALGSVPRSIKDPITTDRVNIGGFVNMLTAVKNNADIRRMVYAASSSSYGDSPALPKVEGNEGKPLSPYAITKWVNELYGDVYSKTYGFHTIGLRYFNVFGPRQSPDNPYAAVIPLFMKAVIGKKKATIFGDGKTSRDFTFVENVVQANIKSLLLEELNSHEVLNIACGKQTSLNELWSQVSSLGGFAMEPDYMPERAGDIKHSLASVEKANALIGYNPGFSVEEGIAITFKSLNASL